MKKFAVTLLLIILATSLLCSCVIEHDPVNSDDFTTSSHTVTETETDAETVTETETEAPPEIVYETYNIFKYEKNKTEINISTAHAIIIDANNNEILYMNGDPYERIYPASTTKLMTALVALKYCTDPSVIIKPGEECRFIKKGSSTAYIKERHKLSLEMLIEGMMLPSGGDAAFVVAAYAGRIIKEDDTLSPRAAVDAFVEEMNRYGKEELGLVDTHFTCPDGDHDDDHYTTLIDIMTISRYAMDDPIIAKYGSTVHDDVVYESGHKNSWDNTNLLIDKTSKYYLKFADGLKTGTTDEAGCCLVATASQDGKRVLTGIFGAVDTETRFSESRVLLTAGLGFASAEGNTD